MRSGTSGDIYPRLDVKLANSAQEIRDAQRLRWLVFAEEQGARIDTPLPGYDIDDLDEHCEHLIVTADRQVIGTYRLLTAEAARRAGGYYSEREFELGTILRPDQRLLEIGRSCVLPAYRTGATIAMLWSGLAAFLIATRHDALIGCASIPLGADPRPAATLAHALAREYAAPAPMLARPRTPLPEASGAADGARALPPLVKGYLRSGARVCGAPCWDADFNCADLFLYLGIEQLPARYARRFVGAPRAFAVEGQHAIDAAA